MKYLFYAIAAIIIFLSVMQVLKGIFNLALALGGLILLYFLYTRFFSGSDEETENDVKNIRID